MGTVRGRFGSGFRLFGWCLRLLGAGGGAEPVAVAAGFDDVGVERDAVDDGGCQARVGEGMASLINTRPFWGANRIATHSGTAAIAGDVPTVVPSADAPTCRLLASAVLI